MIELFFENIWVSPDLTTQIKTMRIKPGDATVIQFSYDGNQFFDIISKYGNAVRLDDQKMPMTFSTNKVVMRFCKKNEKQQLVVIAIARIEFRTGNARIITKEGDIVIR